MADVVFLMCVANTEFKMAEKKLSPIEKFFKAFEPYFKYVFGVLALISAIIYVSSVILVLF